MSKADIIVDVVMFALLAMLVIVALFFLKDWKLAIWPMFVSGMYFQSLINAFWEWFRKDSLY